MKISNQVGIYWFCFTRWDYIASTAVRLLGITDKPDEEVEQILKEEVRKSETRKIDPDLERNEKYYWFIFYHIKQVFVMGKKKGSKKKAVVFLWIAVI